MNKLETREQAEQRAMELFPKVPLFHNNYVSNKGCRIGFLQCWEEMQDNRITDPTKTCGYCIKPSKENQRKLLSEMMREDEKDGIYEESQRMSEQSSENVNESVDCPVCGTEYTIEGKGETHYYLPKDNQLREAVEFIGTLIEGDFGENTMTFEIEGEMILQAGTYKITQIKKGK